MRSIHFLSGRGFAACRSLALTAALVLSLPPAPSVAQSGALGGEWRTHGGDLASSRHVAKSHFREDNLPDVEIVWRWRSPDDRVSGRQNYAFEATPLMVDGVLYTSTSFSQVAAIDPGNGKTLWTYDPRSYLSGRPPNNGFLHRGVSYWSDGEENRILMATGDGRLLSLVAETGRLDPEFGVDGEVDLRIGIPRLEGTSIEYGQTSPALVVGDVVVVGSSVHDGNFGPEGPPGDVRGYDARTGERLWTFHTVPQPGELGNDTWGADSWSYAGGANVWAPMSADPELGYMYLPVSCPTNNYNGGTHPGDNLFANSLVALDVASGERVWHFQTVHHDIWDYDLASAPNLVDITVDNRRIEAVAQLTKHGYVFVFDRATGEPVWPINEVVAPAGAVPGERLSPTQPAPTRPPPFTRQGVSIDELVDFDSQIRADAIDLIDQYDWGPLFTPPTERGTILFPGIGGGANWGGASFDPESGTLYIASTGALPFLIRLVPGGPTNLYVPDIVDVLRGPRDSFYLFKPPWGQITAMDLNRGEILWQAPNDGGANGIAGISSLLLAGDLLFHVNRSEPVLRVFDKTSGRYLRALGLPARGTGAPMTYVFERRQYLVVAVGAGQQRNELVAFALPEIDVRIEVGDFLVP